MRTGSAAAVSAKWLARKNSKVLAIAGAGHMAAGVLATCNEVFEWQEVRIWSRSEAHVESLPERAAAEVPAGSS
jgi:alanine dehydrogenase